jgi:hypothetical protein
MPVNKRVLAMGALRGDAPRRVVQTVPVRLGSRGDSRHRH